jgi:hypothetical protein
MEARHGALRDLSDVVVDRDAGDHGGPASNEAAGTDRCDCARGGLMVVDSLLADLGEARDAAKAGEAHGEAGASG